jgi:hypothetical protein
MSFLVGDELVQMHFRVADRVVIGSCIVVHRVIPLFVVRSTLQVQIVANIKLILDEIIASL